MVAKVKTSLSIPRTLCDQAETLARQLGISRNHLFEIAIENFIRSQPGRTPPDETDTTDPAQPGIGRLVINQGDVYWVRLDEPGIRHPHVVIQDDVLNHSRITTVVVCALTSNAGRASMPGNVLLEAGEANLLRQSVVEVSKVSSVDKSRLGDYIGSLSGQRVDQIVAGMWFLQRAFFAR